MCHPTKDGPLSSLIGRIREHLRHGEGRLVNRLDRETSGLVVVAKTAAVARELGAMFASGAVRKTYWALAHGHPVSDVFTIDAALGRDEESPVAIKDRVHPDGAPARTDVEVLCRSRYERCEVCWVEATPHTGRKHQIRIHLQHAGHPIVGDKIYGGDERRYLRFVAGALTAADHAALLLPHHALHARSLVFRWRGRDWRFEAEPDASFSAMLAACRI